MSTNSTTNTPTFICKFSKQAQPHFVRLDEFDASRLRICDAIAFGKGSQTTVKSYARYLNDKGDLCKPYFQVPKQFCFGIQPTYPYSQKDLEAKPDSLIDGFQVCYCLNSIDTVDNPTPEEQKAAEIFDAIAKLTKDAFCYESSKPKPPPAGERSAEKTRVVPPLVTNAYASVKSGDEEAEYYIKPFFEFPNELDSNKKQTGKKDTSKSRRAYIPLVSYGGGDKGPLDLKTIIMGPDMKGRTRGEVRDKTGLMFRDVKGEIEPVLVWEGLWWGSHSQKPWVVNAQIKVSECNYTPVTNIGKEHRFLDARPDLMPPDEDLDNPEDADFIDPNGVPDLSEQLGNGDAKNPMDALLNAAKDADPEVVEQNEQQVTPEKSQKKKDKEEKREKRKKHKDRS